MLGHQRLLKAAMLALIAPAAFVLLPNAGHSKMTICAPGEHMFDLSDSIPSGTAAVWLVPIGPFQMVTYYQLGHPEGRVSFGGGGNGSRMPRRIDLHGPPLFCVTGEGVEGFVVERLEPGA
jgi:hypothetical protein